jgi:biopolymer transport protein TolR
MRSGKRVKTGGPQVQAEINVTSLVDVAFTLLVIFIITAPIMQGGVEVDLPQANVAPLTPDSEPIIVSLTSTGQTFIGDAEVPAGEFNLVLDRVLEARNAAVVYVNADSTIAYGRVMNVLSTINEKEGVAVSLMAESRQR